MKTYHFSPCNSNNSNKDTEILYFLKVVQSLRPISKSLLETLAGRFSVTTYSLATLIVEFGGEVLEDGK